MKLFRFMSKKEFDKLKKGEVLINTTIHKGFTNSVGFCFMNVNDNNPEYAYMFLSGIVSDEVCVVFQTNKKLKKSWGRYASPYGAFFDTMMIDEYCTKNYSLQDFKIIKYTTKIPSAWDEDADWNWKEIKG